VLHPTFAVAVVVAAAVFTRSYEGRVEPGAVLSAVERLGPKEAVRELLKGNQWEAVLDGIASGQDDWLEVAGALVPGTDAGATSELRVALFMALGPAAKAVLAEVSPGGRIALDLTLVCDASVAIDHPDTALDLVRDRIERLQGVTDERLRKQKEECVKGLLEAERLLANK
jgi:hypothetical protein